MKTTKKLLMRYIALLMLVSAIKTYGMEVSGPSQLEHITIALGKEPAIQTIVYKGDQAREVTELLKKYAPAERQIEQWKSGPLIIQLPDLNQEEFERFIITELSAALPRQDISRLSLELADGQSITYIGEQAQEIADLLKNTGFFSGLLERWQRGATLGIKVPEITKKQFKRFAGFLKIADAFGEQKPRHVFFFDTIPLAELYDSALAATYLGAPKLLKYIIPAIVGQEKELLKQTGNFSRYLRDIPRDVSQEWNQFMPQILKDITPAILLPVHSLQPSLHIAEDNIKRFPTLDGQTIKFWNPITVTLLKEITIKDKPVQELHTWPFGNERFLLIDYDDNSFDVWNITKKKLILSKDNTDEQKIVYTVHPLENDKKNIIIFIVSDGTAQVWDLSTEEKIAELTNVPVLEDKSSYFIEWDNDWIMLGDFSSTNDISRLNAVFKNYSNEVLSTINYIGASQEKFTENKTKLIFINDDRTIEVVNVPTGQRAFTLEYTHQGERKEIMTYALSDQYIAATPMLEWDGQGNVTNADLPIIVWDINTGNVVTTIDRNNEADVYLMIVNNKLFATTQAGSLFIWELPSGKLLNKIDLPKKYYPTIIDSDKQLNRAVIYAMNPEVDAPANYTLVNIEDGSIISTIVLSPLIFKEQNSRVTPLMSTSVFFSLQKSGIINTVEKDGNPARAVTIFYFDAFSEKEFSFEQMILIDLLKERHKVGIELDQLLRNSYIKHLYDAMPQALKDALILVPDTTQSLKTTIQDNEQTELIQEEAIMLPLQYMFPLQAFNDLVAQGQLPAEWQQIAQIQGNIVQVNIPMPFAQWQQLNQQGQLQQWQQLQQEAWGLINWV